jgi:predicted porin
MRILLFLIYLFPSLSLAEENTYLQTSFIFATRNFEEATPTNTNDGIESWTEGFSIGGGYRFSTSFALELEYLQSDGFKVQNQNQNGEISVYALTIGLGIVTTYQINKSWSGLVDIGGLWANEDIEDFDFIPLQVGIRFYF